MGDIQGLGPRKEGCPAGLSGIPLSPLVQMGLLGLVGLVAVVPPGAVGVSGAGGHWYGGWEMVGGRGCFCLVSGGAVGREEARART